MPRSKNTLNVHSRSFRIRLSGCARRRPLILWRCFLTRRARLHQSGIDRTSLCRWPDGRQL
jgi:hypothetical protein